jgi:hypothetical protein
MRSGLRLLHLSGGRDDLPQIDYVKRQRKRLDPQKVVLEVIKAHGLEKIVSGH